MGEKDEVPDMLRQILDGQKQQSDKLEQHGEQLDEYGGALEELSSSVGDLKGQTEVNFGVIGTQFENLKERATEDRERADKKESELEGKVGDAHKHANEVGTKTDTLAGKFENHIEDDHATVAMQTKTDLATHVKNRDQHTGTAPKTEDDDQGPGVHPGVKYGGAGVGGAGLLYGLIELIKALTAN